MVCTQIGYGAIAMNRLPAMRLVLVVAGALIMAACGGSSPTTPNSSSQTTPNGNVVQDPTNLSGAPSTGVLTLMERTWLGDDVAMIHMQLPDDIVERAGTGANPWRHSSGRLVHTIGCGRLVNRVQTLNTDGSVDILTPCSSVFDSPGILARQFAYGQLSPSGELLAVEAQWLDTDFNRSDVWVFRDSEVIYTIQNAYYPTWVNDDMLIVTGAGLFRYPLGGQPELINDNIIAGVGGSDVSPDGTRLAFEWNQQIWTMGLNGENRSELVTGNKHFVDPVWSPDGQFVAFLSTGDKSEETDINYVTVANGSRWVSRLENQLGTANRVTGPLSWIY